MYYVNIYIYSVNIYICVCVLYIYIHIIAHNHIHVHNMSYHFIHYITPICKSAPSDPSGTAATNASAKRKTPTLGFRGKSLRKMLIFTGKMVKMVVFSASNWLENGPFMVDLWGNVG